MTFAQGALRVSHSMLLDTEHLLAPTRQLPQDGAHIQITITDNA